MTQDRMVSWSGGLRQAAESFFGVALDEVEFHTGPEAARIGAAAFARGNHVHFDGNLRLSARDFLELLGHELAHVVQQRQGRASAYSEELEREAIEEGRRFAHGEPSAIRGRPGAAACAPVVQRAVVVGGRALADANELSPSAAIVLGLIDNGSEWLTWAIRNPAVNYGFAGESELIAGMQSGLHGRQLLLMPGLSLLTHPARLLQLPADDLKVIAAAEQDSDANSVTQMQARKILARQQLLTQTELAIGDEFLTQTGVGSAPVFQALELADRVALFQMVDGATSEASLNPTFQKEAAAFATLHAQTPLEFVDYYRFYLAMADDSAADSKGAAARGRKAEVSLETLRPMLFGMLFCPAVQKTPTPDQLNAIIQSWIAAGNTLGFGRLSLAISQVGQNAGLNGATGDAATKAIAEYVEQAQDYLLQRPASAAALSQDGEETQFVYESEQASARVSVEASGNVTLAGYRRI